jgi:thiamine pyrophosphokinase
MRIVIFANGVMADPAVEAAAWIRPGDLVVAADGGSLHALDAGITPSVVIGDLDSLSDDLLLRLEAERVAFHRAPAEKDETDLELALMWAAEQQDVEEIVVLGAFGGRPDQALANLLLLAHPALTACASSGADPGSAEAGGCRVAMVDRAWTVVLIRGGETLALYGRVGDRVSLLPLGGPAEGVTTRGLAFPLHDEMLLFGPARGVSNRLAREAAMVSVRRGLLWCFHEHQSDVGDARGEEG